jgi:transcriptional regulator with XRE-family HTH domain
MRIVRQANGLTQAQVAAKLGITREYVTKFESGARRINQRTAKAFVQVINEHKDRAKGRQSKTA